jgi:tartrate/fumarate subfamily iron-sulfur-dependent hydro-lyase alpha chain
MAHEAATVLRADVLAALQDAATRERNPRGRRVLQLLIENAAIAATDDVPLCQDTGTVWLRVETGPDITLPAGLQTAVDARIAQVWERAGLRASVLRDALFERTNTGGNTPTFIEIAQVTEPGLTLHLMLKGGGSDNASQVCMLSPDGGVDAVVDAVVARVRDKASAACPPLIIGVGVGATFDKVAGLSKRALLRPVGSVNPDPQAAALEARLLAAVNDTGIGPAGTGGDTTALAVHVMTAPCHIAALPLAINLGCSALRTRTRRL